MKRIILFLSAVIITAGILAQTPQGISHQAVMRDAEKNLIVESPIGLQVSIIQGTHDGVAVYVETHNVMTNKNGLISYVIGDGDVVQGMFQDIDWAHGPYWLETKADPTGGEDYSITGITKFFSVPYSMYVEFAGHAETFSGLDALLARIEAIEEALDIDVPDGTVTDIDGNVYQTVIIGNQEWMAENLRVTRDANGNNITRYCYGNNTTNCELYGGLYTWHTIMNGENSSYTNPSGVQGICPDGWHVPSYAQWTELINYVVNQGFPNSTVVNGAGNALKSCRQVGSPLGGDCDTSEHPRWNSDGTHYGFDEYGFSALPSGFRWIDGSFGNLGSRSYWWSSTEHSSSNTWSANVGHSYGLVGRHFEDKTSGFSLRCVRNISEGSTFFNLNIEVYPENAGTATGAGEYEEGEVVEIIAIANAGWEFVNWTGDTDYIDNPHSENAMVTMPSGDVTLTANFQEGESDIIYGDGVTDIDGNEYITVIIGDQEWMAENLRVTRYNNEDDIPTSLSDSEWENTTSGAYAIYNNDDDMLEAYGKLYNWYAVDDSRGLCPEGWSVPSDEDWTELVDYIADQGFPNSNVVNGAANALKSCRQVNSPLGGECNTSTHPRWSSHDTHFGLNEFGFSGLPGGYRSTDGNYGNIGYGGYWWSSSEYSSTDAWFRYMNLSLGNVHRLNYGIKKVGLSVRCIKE